MKTASVNFKWKRSSGSTSLDLEIASAALNSDPKTVVWILFFHLDLAHPIFHLSILEAINVQIAVMNQSGQATNSREAVQLDILSGNAGGQQAADEDNSIPGEHGSQTTAETRPKFQTVDFWVYKDKEPDPCQLQSTTGSEIDTWLDSPAPADQESELCAGIRLIIGHQTTAEKSPFTEAHIRSFSKDSNLSALLHSILTGSIAVNCRLSTEDLTPGEVFSKYLE